MPRRRIAGCCGAAFGLATAESPHLRDSDARIEIVGGDARLSLERSPPQAVHLLAVDAFSSDSIPIHLLTSEALGVYQQHLAPGGIIAIHSGVKPQSQKDQEPEK